MTILPGNTFDFDGFSLQIVSQDHHPSGIISTPRLPLTAVEIGSKVPIERPEVQYTVKKIIFNVAKRVAPELLIEPAKRISDLIGIRPDGWRISKARRRSMGSCSSKRIISFSPLLVFMPLEVRNYIACHELAHLVHFDHSDAFHILCNNICLHLYGKPEWHFKKALKMVFRDRESMAYLIATTP